MAETMTPSITDEQIEKALEQMRAAMRKHRREISKDIAQQVLGLDNLGMRLYAPLRELAQTMSGLTIHIVKVDRSRTPKQALVATGRTQYVTASVVEAMPRGECEEVGLVFFKPDASAYQDRLLSCQALAREYEKRGLVPDPIALAAFAEKKPAFFDDKPVGSQWQSANGNYCYATFNRWGDERHVYVRRYDYDWHDAWSFAGVRKESSASAL